MSNICPSPRPAGRPCSVCTARALHGMERHSTAWHICGMAWYGIDVSQHGLAHHCRGWCSSVWCGIAAQHSLAWCLLRLQP